MLSEINESDRLLPVVFGLAGHTLTKAETAFFNKSQPFGFILFARNCKDSAQVKKLVKALHKCVGREAPILIDQEGGRVQRLKGSNWKDHASAQNIGTKFSRDFITGQEAVKAHATSIASELTNLGIHVNCAPVMDVLYPETDKSIGDRAFSLDPDVVAVMGAATCRYHLENGVIPVIKHMPGQGRAQHDSHEELPVIDTQKREMMKTDFIPFREMQSKTFSEATWGMVAHVVYKALDPESPATCSRRVIFDTIRGDLGFTGLLLSDDICMDALKQYGGAELRAEKALRSGCDIVLHCNGNIEEMKSIAARVPVVTDKTANRYNRSVSWLKRNCKK